MSESHQVAVYAEEELRRGLPMNEAALEAVERAFVWLVTGRAQVPSPMHLAITGARGEVDVKGAYVADESSFAIKVASGFFGNVDRGLPTGSGLMVVLSAETGFCQAVLLDNGYLTDLRTALAGAIAAKYLASRRCATVGVVGTGTQARFQVEALRLVRDFERVLVWGRKRDRVEAYREDLASRLGSGVEIVEAAGLRELVAESSVVVTTTPSRDPLLRAEWLHPGLHITAMGADRSGKQELEADLLRRADLLVCDSLAQARELGELQHLSQEESAAAVELGTLIEGSGRGRTSEEVVTVCDLTGVGVQDTAIALFALEALG